jgi:hypothetical protein
LRGLGDGDTEENRRGMEPAWLAEVARVRCCRHGWVGR